MSVDHIRYDLLTQQALRAVVRRVLADISKTGVLPGEHHFYITFDTRAPGVRISKRLQEQYPEEMTIVLQHQFWDLVVSDTHFEVGLSFNGITEKLYVPLEAIKGFFDPSVQFGLQFDTGAETQKTAAAAEKPALAMVPDGGAKPAAKTAAPRRKPALAPEAPAAVGPAESAKPPALVADADKGDPDKPSGGAEVVRLDRFRKK
ncbi:MAG: uncharacterized protein V7608_1037 [Hyphomicrobiales bacterium]|jgi:hypothetical protein